MQIFSQVDFKMNERAAYFKAFIVCILGRYPSEKLFKLNSHYKSGNKYPNRFPLSETAFLFKKMSIRCSPE